MNPALKALLTVSGYFLGVALFAWFACALRAWYGRKYLGESSDEAGWM